MKLKTASGLISLYMRTFGFKGWASFWNTIYVLPGYENSKSLIRHESKHIEQINREGIIKFTIAYMWYLITVGYKNNPYEIEARKAEYETN